jgi:hypothetical protein
MYCIYKSIYISNFALDCHNFWFGVQSSSSSSGKFGAISVWRLILFHKSAFTNAPEFLFKYFFFLPKLCMVQFICHSVALMNGTQGIILLPTPTAPPTKLCRVVVLCMSCSCSNVLWKTTSSTCSART